MKIDFENMQIVIDELSSIVLELEKNKDLLIIQEKNLIKNTTCEEVVNRLRIVENEFDNQICNIKKYKLAINEISNMYRSSENMIINGVDGGIVEKPDFVDVSTIVDHSVVEWSMQ